MRLLDGVIHLIGMRQELVSTLVIIHDGSQDCTVMMMNELELTHCIMGATSE